MGKWIWSALITGKTGWCCVCAFVFVWDLAWGYYWWAGFYAVLLALNLYSRDYQKRHA